MNNPAGCVEVPLGVYGGLNTNMQPTDLPAGLSPDCSDVAFLPGSVYTRPWLQQFSTRGTTSQTVYNASYVKPDGSVSQLVWYADGALLVDNVQIGSTRAGNRFQTSNTFGRMYIATSDGLHGADVPLQLSPDGNLDRVSQDGPGGAPNVANYAIPQVALVTGSAGAAVSITSATPINPEQVQVGGGNDSQNPYDPGGGGGYQPPQYETYYTSLQFITGAAHGLTVGEAVTIAGNSIYNFGSATVSFVGSTTEFEIIYQSPSPTVGTGGTVTPVAPLLVRNNNLVTAQTAVAHQLRPGYQVTIAGVSDATQSISSIVIDNNTMPGVATVTTPNVNGFVPGNVVAISGVQPSVVGGGLASYVITAGTTSVTTNTAHLLAVGDVVVVTLGASGQPFSVTVTAVPSATQFVFPTTGAVSTGTVGSVYLPWVPTSGKQFTITATPSATTFEIAASQGNGTWNTGTISFPWNGTFYVSSVPSSTSFIYAQTGPNDSIQSGTGTVTPMGQLAPGNHKAVVIFLTRTGYLTRPSPSVTISASGDQYLFVSNIPIGPSNVIARIIALTGANGGNYFYLPVPPQLNGQIIGTSTVVNDNTTTSAIFDFSDQALLSATAIDIPGNNLFRQVVLGPCLGFYSYASRLIAWGERNKVQSFLNMGFEGGFYFSSASSPTGWTQGSGFLTSSLGDYGPAYQFNATGSAAALSQPAYQDEFNVPILLPQTQYTFRLWSSGSGTVTADFYSPSVGVVATAVVAVNGGFNQANFNQKTGVQIPPDTILRIYPSVSGTVIDEMEIIYTLNPYLLSARVSYINNPEAFDGVTGILGPATDPHPVMCFEERRDVLSILTFGPNGSLYETEDTASGEPVTWNLRHVASKCGIISVWGAAKFEDWFVWASDTGLRIYDGGTVDKMSQEVQPFWDSFNPAAKQFTVLGNDPYTRRLYILACTGAQTVTRTTYVMDYRELNTAAALANSGTLRIGQGGKVLTTDLTRKWSPWTVQANYCGVIALAGGGAVMTFCGGNGSSLSATGYSTVYTLNEVTMRGYDDDYGPYWQNSFYSTYFMVSEDEAQQRQLGAHRLLHSFLSSNVSGVGLVSYDMALDRLDNVKYTTRALSVTEDIARDLEFGLNQSAERISYTVRCRPAGVQPPAPTAPAGFRLSSMLVAMRTDPYAPIRGRNG